jgi:MFS family permease
MAGLWATTMMIFAYVDIFSLFRPDFRAALDQGKVFVFDVGQPFLLGVTIYVIIPSLMIYLSLVMPRRLNRVVSISLAGLYAITIVGGAVGEWSYYVLGSVVEVVLLALVIHHSWTWRAPKTD